MPNLDHSAVARDVRTAYENIHDMIGAAEANQTNLVTEMRRIVGAIERASWFTGHPKQLLAVLQEHITSAENARTASSIEKHVRAFSTAVRSVIDPW